MSNWENLKPKLHVPNYWISKTCTQWSAQDFCHHLLQANPSYSKRSAMSLFSEDLDVIRVQLAHHKLISSRVKALVKQLSKKDELLDQFWAEYSTNIKSISLKRKYNVFVAGSLLEEEAIETLQQQAAIKNSQGEELGNSRQTEDDGAPQEVNNDDTQDKRIEHDDVYVSNSSLSVGTIIKREAIKIHEVYAQNLEKCPVDDRKVMTNGLSSILDLCDQSLNSQQRLFSLKQWHELLERFSFLKLQPSCLSKQVLDTICIVTNCCQSEGDMTSALAYTKALKDQAERAEDVLAYKVVNHSLKLLRDYPLMLIKNTPINYTESDYLYVLWMKVFKTMFPPEKSLVRIKTGESIFSTSTASKKELYPDAKDIRGFKIDIRFVVDVDRKEIDVAAAEVAKDDNKDKTISDQGKLSREGKDIVDNLVDIVDVKIIKSCRAYLFQIAGSECIVSSISLGSNGLYVVLHQNDISLPCSPQGLDNFSSSLPFLSSCRREIESLALEVKTKSSQKFGTRKVLGLEQTKKVWECIHWVRGTYYSPPPKSTSAIPCSLFGSPPPNILSKLKSAYEKDTGRAYRQEKEEKEQENPGEYDVYGWKRRSDGKFYNKFSKTVADEHPAKRNEKEKQIDS